MSSYSITTGILNTPVKVVLYGPEGIGKSTFASHFPDPVFIDTEGGTKRLNVARLPQPTSWAMLLDEVRAVTRGEVSCGTLVIDTADWAERLAIDAICAKAKVDGLEGFGYGKGYTYVKEEFGRLLDALEEVLNSGHHVLILAHAAITKFEQPDAAGSYDRWTMKTTKQTEPLLREWCDMLLFANYQTIVEKSGSGPNAKNKATGGKRVLYTTHHACWDAKNRFGLPDEVPFDYASIAHCITGPASAPPATRRKGHSSPSQRTGTAAQASAGISPGDCSRSPADARPHGAGRPRKAGRADECQQRHPRRIAVRRRQAGLFPGRYAHQGLPRRLCGGLSRGRMASGASDGAGQPRPAFLISSS